MNQLCTAGLIPGIMTDCNGQCFQYYRREDGSIWNIPVDEPSVSTKTQAELMPVAVESKSRLVPGSEHLEPWVEVALARGTLFKAGDVYRSLQCFQGRIV